MDVVLVVVVTALAVGCPGTDAIYKRSCTETDSSRVSLPLDCSANHVIHVLQWVTALGATGNVSQCQFHTDCFMSGDSDNNEFFPECNGKTTCNEEVDLNGKSYCVNGTKLRYVQLEYECILETWNLNICDYTSASATLINASSVYIKTPAFPGRYGIVFNQICTCAVYGEDLTVKVLSLKISDRGVISIANDSAVVWSVATLVQQWNRDIAGLQGPGTSHVNITFHDHGSSGEEAWLQISGLDGNISIACGRGDDLGGTTVTPSTSIGSMSYSSSPSTPTPTTTPITSTLAISTYKGVASLHTSAESPLLPTTGSAPWTSSPSHHSSPEVPPVTTPDVSTHSTPSATPRSNQSCVNASCPVGDGLIRGTRTILAIAISASVGGVLLLIFIIVIIVVCRGRLCRGRDPTYARTEAPVAEDPHPYTELRIYEDLRSFENHAMANRTDS